MMKSPARMFKVLLHDIPPLNVLRVVPVRGSQTQQFHNCPEHSLVTTTSILDTWLSVVNFYRLLSERIPLGLQNSFRATTFLTFIV